MMINKKKRESRCYKVWDLAISILPQKEKRKKRQGRKKKKKRIEKKRLTESIDKSGPLTKNSTETDGNRQMGAKTQPIRDGQQQKKE